MNKTTKSNTKRVSIVITRIICTFTTRKQQERIMLALLKWTMKVKPEIVIDMWTEGKLKDVTVMRVMAELNAEEGR